MTDADNLYQAMIEAGLAMYKPTSILADGKVHRYRVAGDKAGSLNGWHVLHLEAKAFGAFGSWKLDKPFRWSSLKPETMTPAERQAFAARMQEVRAAHEAETAKVQAEAANRALRLWDRSKPASNDHPYLVKKRVHAYGIRDLRGQLVIPLRDVDGKLRSLQFIGTDGRKTFLTGGRMRGCYHPIGRPRDVLCLCEGYATGATLHQATGHATAVAFNAGNLEPVARALRGKFPTLALVVCADDDAATPGNPGLTAARKAAQAVGAALAVPRFEEVRHV